MGQARVASATWRDPIRRIFQGFYETVGQQIPQTRASEPMRARSHVKMLNFEINRDIPSETERNQSNFSTSGMALNRGLCAAAFRNSGPVTYDTTGVSPGRIRPPKVGL